jgi:hypothetical protein
VIRTRIAAASVAALALGLTGIASAAEAGTTPATSHKCDNAKAAAAHARNQLRKAEHQLAKATHEVKEAKASGDHAALKAARADRREAQAKVATREQKLADAKAQKRHNCTNGQTTGKPGGTTTA